MKKYVCLIICVLLLCLTLASCGNRLPEGEASSVELTSGVHYVDVHFKYVNETTVQISKDGGSIKLIPITSIKVINVKSY